MKAKQLMNPRFEVIADYPNNVIPIGTVMECPKYDNDFTKDYWVQSNENFPHLFKRLNWCEKRKKEDMPMRLICKAIQNDTEIMKIKEWDMDILVGWLDKESRKCCSLLTFNPEYGYFPVDAD